MPKRDIANTLREMLDAYADDEGTDDLNRFVGTWASLLEPDTAPVKQEVLVTGNPFDGFTIEGPYPHGFLTDEGVLDAREDTCWIVKLDEPNIKDRLPATTRSK